MEKLERPLVLCGFMGCGKTTAGAQAARLAGVPFVDADDLIAEAAGMSIPELFARKGEPYFRKLERQIARRIAAMGGLVAATGGGMLIGAENAAILRETCTVIHLICPFEACYRRVACCKGVRPLVEQNTPDQLQELYDRRLPLYHAVSHLTVDVDCGVEEAAQRIVAAGLRKEKDKRAE